MRLFTVALLALLAAMSVAAIPISTTLPITLYDPGGYGDTMQDRDVLGQPRSFDVDYVRFVIIATGEVQAQIHTNFNFDDNGNPLILDGWCLHGCGPTETPAYMNSGDLLFDVGPTYKYAVPITPHDLLTAGALYAITNVKTADAVLGDSPIARRPDVPVWMDPAGASPIGDKIDLTWTLDGYPSPGGIITLRFIPTDGFLADLADPGLSVHFASATCANDTLDGDFRYAVPEPMSMALMGGGLVGLGLLGRRRLLRRK